jgi:predicted transcriptional regulator
VLKPSLIYKRTNFKRGVLELMTEILDALSQEMLRKTHITFRCNLDSRAVTKYVKTLRLLGFIEPSKKDSKYFEITTKGREFLKKYDDLISLLVEDEDQHNTMNELKDSLKI